MAIEELPGWGDNLAAILPQLGNALDKIIQPNAQYVRLLQSQLAQNPELAGKLAQAYNDNPQAVSAIYGGHADNILKSLKLNQEQLNKGRLADVQGQVLNSPAANDIGRTSLGLPTTIAEQGQALKNQGQGLENQGQIIKNDTSSLKLNQERAAAQFLANLPPEQRNDAYYKQLFGVLKVDYDKAQHEATAIDQAKPWIGKGNAQIFSAYRRGQISSDALQGLWDVNPGAMQMMLKDMEADENRKARIDVAALARKNGRYDTMNSLYLQTAKTASELGVKGPALFEAEYGKDAINGVDGIVANYNADDVKTAAQALQNMNVYNRANRLKPVLTAFSILNKSNDAGSMAMFNAAAQAAGIDLQAVPSNRFLGSFRGPGVTYTWNGQEIGPNDVASVLNSGSIPGQTKSPPAAAPAGGERSVNTKGQGSSRAPGTPATKAPGLVKAKYKLNDEAFNSLGANADAKDLVKASIEQGFNRDVIVSSKLYRNLSADAQAKVLQSLGIK